MDHTPPQPPRLRPRTPAAPPPPPPPADVVPAAAPTPEPEPRKVRVGMSAWARRWLKFGGQGLMVSLLIHGGLLFLATAWVVSVAVIQKKEPNTFATGAGGGTGGERAVQSKAKAKPNTPKSLTKSASKITSKSTSAQISLPEMPDLNRAALGALSASSKGFGGGAGGGVGGSVGLGKGGKNFTGRAVMGMKISGANIAVYFDSSPSMNPYFAAVEKQIKEQFPSADVYRYFGVFNFIQDGEVLGARANQKLVVPTVDQIYMDRSGGRRDSPATDPAKLSPAGRNLFGSKDALFRIGGVGAWIEGMLNQKQYDAIVVFSDFEDGVIQWRTIGEVKPTIVFDADLRPPTDLRTEAEKAWEARWIRTFATAQDRKAPRLYLYSTSREPQEIYRRCVSASGGDFKIVTMARGGLFGTPVQK
ncbi:MAG: hypothetical protein ACKO8X_08620 [Verrucomicrobiota bacterium]